MLAIMSNHVEVVRILIEGGAKLDGVRISSLISTTPLVEACMKGFYSIVSLLIENGANVEIKDYVSCYSILLRVHCFRVAILL